MNSAQSDGDSSSALQTAQGLRSLLLARIYTAKYLASNIEKDANRVEEEFNDLTKNLDIIRNGLQNPKRRSQLNEAKELIETYKNGVSRIVTIIKERNQIINNKLNIIGPKIAKLSEEVKLSNKKIKIQ